MADPTSLPQSAWNWIAGIVVTVLTAIIGWNWKDQAKKVSDQGKEIGALKVQAAGFACTEDIARDYVKRSEFAAMEVNVAGLASRRELIAYMREHREQQQRWEQQQERRHDENKEAMRDICAASLLRDKHAQEFRTEMRNGLQNLALKVEAVSTIQKVQGAPGS
jgi:hypothetical protein